jgi:peptide-methionine (S)-S-oxide reductase
MSTIPKIFPAINLRNLAPLLGLLAFTGLSTAARAETAIFAGGCFWCVEKDMDHIKGVTSTTSGYAGGTNKKATYRNHEGHTESVRVEFDPKIVSYDELVKRFLRTIDVTDGEGQFCDRGPSYTTAVFATSPEQKEVAEAAIKEAAAVLGKDIATPVREGAIFVQAEDYHQNYYMGDNRVLTRFGLIRQSEAYKNYRQACGRDARVKQVWGKQAYTDGKGGES